MPCTAFPFKKVFQKNIADKTFIACMIQFPENNMMHLIVDLIY